MTDEDRIVRFMIEKQARLGSILRFSTIPNVGHETVAEHSYYVSFLTMLVCQYLNKNGTEVDSLKAIQMALLHDVEEAVSGDILGPLKSGNFLAELDKLNAKSMSYLCDSLGVPYNYYYYDIWREYRDQGSIEAKVVGFVDLFSCLVHAIKELHCGNRYFKEIVIGVSSELADYLQSVELGDCLVPIAAAFYDYTLKYLEEDEEVMRALEVCLRVEALK